MATSELIFVGVEMEGVFDNLLHRAPLTPAAASASTNRYLTARSSCADLCSRNGSGHSVFVHIHAPVHDSPLFEQSYLGMCCHSCHYSKIRAPLTAERCCCILSPVI